MTKMIETPEYIDSLVLYEIATKAFTSPNGAESGTFNGVSEKISYLQELGVTGIWLTGHQLCNPNHFYNIWTQYACIDPTKLDPTLGTAADFANMVATAHQHGIKVFLDNIPHGIMKDSPLVAEHPEWFIKGSWGMIDFDWYGNHSDLDEWWLEMLLHYIVDFGIDGYRIDVAHYRNDLWATLRKRAKEAGKEILLIAENGPAFLGVIDMLQHGEQYSDHVVLFKESRMLWDSAGHFNDRSKQLVEQYYVEVIFEDGSSQKSYDVLSAESRMFFGGMQIVPLGAETEVILDEEAGIEYQIEFMAMRLENIRMGKRIVDIVVTGIEKNVWHYDKNNTLEVDYYIEVEGKAPSLKIRLPIRQQAGTYMSNQLSCHDHGWDGSPLDENPYTAQGSRYLWGYGCALTPAVPVFMAGEEFNADYVPLPQHSPRLFGGELNGQGRWLYGSWIQWQQLENPDKKAVLSDVQKILAIRKKYQHLIRPFQIKGTNNAVLKSVAFDSESILPVPYLYVGEKEAICVMANPQNEDVTLAIDIAAALPTWAKMKVKTIFGGNQEELMGVTSPQELSKYRWHIAADYQEQGGLKVLLFEEE